MIRPPLYLVSCTKAKLGRPAPARELYAASDWFAKARAYVEALGAEWAILSAEHGLVHPDEVLAPYETTLNRMAAAERQAWAARVLEPLSAQAGRPIVILAGARYREHLEPAIAAWGAPVVVPMRGLGLGRQKAWLAAATAQLEARR